MRSTRQTITLAGSLLLVTAGATTSAALGLFSQPQLYPVGDVPFDVAVGHLDSNALPDVVVANRSSNDVSVLWNPGGPNVVEVRVATGGRPRAVAIGDLNGDGHADVAVGRELSEPPLAVIYNRGDGTFDLPVPVGNLAVFPDALWIGDLDGDSDQDVVLASAPSNLMIALLNDGIGGFTETSYATDTSPSYPSDLAVGDVDGDRDPDLVLTASLSQQPPVLFLNLGNGVFAPYVTFTELDVVFVSAVVGDLGGDGTTELTLLDFGSSSLAVFPNEGGGAFGDPALFPIGATTQPGGRVRLGDLDADGHLDAVVGLILQNPAIPVLLGDGAGGFGAPVSYPAGAHGISAIVLVDLDADGDLDVAATSKDDDVLIVLRNLTDPATAVPPGDHVNGVVFAAPRPNPGRTPAIAFTLPRPAHVRLAVHDVAGRFIAQLMDATRTAGRHEVVWRGTAANGDRAAAGVYYLRLDANGSTSTQSVVLTR